jgi:large subunit ribosomal protein L27
MATKKAGGTAKNLRDSNPKYLGVKANHGESVRTGMVIVRQRGTVYLAGKNVALGKDHTIFAKRDGKVEFKDKRKTNFDGRTVTRKQVSVL